MECLKNFYRHNVSTIICMNHDKGLQPQTALTQNASCVHDLKVIRDGPLFFWRGGGDEKFSSANNFFKLMRLCNHFFQKHLPANILFYFIFFTVLSSLVRKMFKLKLFSK